MRRPTFIILSLIRWDKGYNSAPFSLAKALSRHGKVFYIDSPLTFRDIIEHYTDKEVQRRKPALLKGRKIYHEIPGTSITAVTPRATIPMNWLPEGFFYEALRKVNERNVFEVIRTLIEDFRLKDYVFINSFLPYYGLTFPESFKPKLHIYQSVDEIEESKYLCKHGPRLERRYTAYADLTIVTSSKLQNKLSRYTRNIHLVPNAADFDLFYSARNEIFARPDELKGIQGKIICYTGNISHRIDYALLKSLCMAHPDKTLLMVGPEDPDETGIRALKSMPNVRFTGPRSMIQLPAILHYAHCTIIPFKINELTKSIYPLKVNEYLATGKPVVSTPFSDDLEKMNDVVYLAEHKNFARAVQLAIDEDSELKTFDRLAVAKLNTWNKRAEQLLDIINRQVGESVPVRYSHIN